MPALKPVIFHVVPRAFDKKTPETPRSEIELARRRLVEMLHEHEEDPNRT